MSSILCINCSSFVAVNSSLSTIPPFVGNETQTQQQQHQYFDNQSTNPAFATDPSALVLFSRRYQVVHGYLSILVCLFGIISNIINVIVLTRRNMTTPTNCLLTAIAVADLLTMVSYLPYASYFYCFTVLDKDYGHARGWILYLIFHTNFIITCHTVAMWLTVVLAVFRYVVVCRQLRSSTMCTMRRAKSAIAAVLLATAIFCLPTYVMYRPSRLSPNSTGFWVDHNVFVTHDYAMLNFWLFGVLLKVAPCAILSLLSVLLIMAMRRVGLKRQKLRSGSSLGNRRGSEKSVDGDHHRSTGMLVAVVLSFVFAELPQGIIALMSGVNRQIFYSVYVPLGDVWDILALVNSSVNFVLYCTMSRQYRQTFSRIFLKPTSDKLTGSSYYNFNIKQSVI